MDEGTDWIKLFDSADGNKEDGAQYSIEELSAIVDEAHKKGVKVAMHTVALEGSHRAIVSGVDGIEHGVDITDADLKLMEERDLTFVPTVSVISYLATNLERGDKAKWEDFFEAKLRYIRESPQSERQNRIRNRSRCDG